MPLLAGVEVSHTDVLDAIRTFDREWPDTHAYEGWLTNGAYRYALVYNGRLYPPKKILNLATGVKLAQFNGGPAQTNRILTEFGFDVIPKPPRRA
jgi:hypothetical protein